MTGNFRFDMVIQLIHQLVQFRLRRLGLKSKRMELKNCLLHYYEFRHSQPQATLVLLHGLGTSSSTWFHLYPFFIKEHSVVAIDLPGFGFSTIQNGKHYLTVPEHIAAVEEFINQMKLSSFTLVGHSLGGWIAAKYAAAHPKSVRQLILINTAGVYHDGVENLQSIFDIHGTTDVRRLVETMWYRYPWYFKPFLSAIGSDLQRRHVPELVKSVQRENFLDDDLHAFSMPVHLIWGTADRLLPRETVRTLEQRVQHLRIDYIEACGHIPQLERPEELERVLGKVLK